MYLDHRLARRAASFAAAFALALPGALPGIGAALAEGEDDEELIEEVVVTGIRGSLRQSIDMKRDADNVMDALVAEDIGKFPDQNLAESLQRVSGVAIDRMRGEGAQVSIRGLGPQFTRVLVNGRGALSGGTQAFAGGVGDHSQQRTFRFESMQAELVQAVEVYKSAQANLMESGMGGTLNIRTRRPFDNGGRRIVAGNAFMTDDDLAEDNGYRFAGVYSDSFADNTLGFLVSVAGDDRVTREDWFAVADSEPKVFNNAINLATGELLRGCSLPGVENPDVGCGYAPGNLRQGILIEDVQRVNLSAALQWRPNEQWDVTADILYSQMDRDYDDWQIPWRYQAGLANGASEVLLN
ncbi:MAG: TonB-dependent receptor plug domain-containing protein, partial [bacterium]|nr:TonB-dependent receptor plug domain-containing protein [bacterium]